MTRRATAAASAFIADLDDADRARGQQLRCWFGCGVPGDSIADDAPHWVDFIARLSPSDRLVPVLAPRVGAALPAALVEALGSMPRPATVAPFAGGKDDAGHRFTDADLRRAEGLVGVGPDLVHTEKGWVAREFVQLIDGAGKDGGHLGGVAGGQRKLPGQFDGDGGEYARCHALAQELVDRVRLQQGWFSRLVSWWRRVSS